MRRRDVTALPGSPLEANSGQHASGAGIMPAPANARRSHPRADYILVPICNPRNQDPPSRALVLSTGSQRSLTSRIDGSQRPPKRPLSLGHLTVFIALTAGCGAQAHGWYEPACCSGVDCAPVADSVVEELPDGVHVSGFGTLAYGDPRLRWSRDYEAHVCATLSSPRKLLCVYRKPKAN